MNIHAKIDAAAGPAARVAAIDWAGVESELDEHGAAMLPKLLTPSECREIAALYPADSRFRSHIVMARHGFGRGEYKYFSYPLPEPIGELRRGLYARLAPIANAWNDRMGVVMRYPAEHEDFNALHQDIYGDLAFPLQVAILLTEPGCDHTGGEFVLTEQRPRMQSRAEVVPLRQGDAVAFAVHHRPVHGTKGIYRVNLRHGVSRVRSGRRYTLGIIFHDAK
jgi:hypothetical protein